MPVEDVFGIKGRGTVATGRIERGTIKIGESVDIVGMSEQIRTVVVTGVEMFQKTLDTVRPATTWAACCGALSGRTSSGGRC